MDRMIMVVLSVLLTFGVGLMACGDSSSPESACSDCPSSVRDICEDGVESCNEVGGPLVDDCIDAIVRACQGR